MNKEKLFALLKEPSTFAGLSGIFVALGVSVEQFESVALVLAAIFGSLGVFLPEKKDS